MRRKLLLVAYHFPPIQGSTGTSRTLAFSKYLRDLGWDVCILTVQPEAYEHVADENNALIPDSVDVQRAWARDTLQHFSVRGKYPLFLALPDRWQSWVLGSMIKGGKIIRRWKPDVIMTTYPIPSAHVIGWLLSKKYSIPWVAEFRDPMLQSDYPDAKWERWAFDKVENLVFSNAKEIIVTTEGCRQMYLARYPMLRDSRITMISNGFDPDFFRKNIAVAQNESRACFVLLHSGLLYSSERDPTAFFEAVRYLKEEGFFEEIKAEFRFRASGDEDNYSKEIARLGIDSIVRLAPRIPYAEAIDEMRQVDALLIFQASNCNDQIPAKVYEYMYCQKPILALTDPIGETGKLLSSVGVKSIARLDSSKEIRQAIRVFLEQLQAGNAFVVPETDAIRFSRKSLTEELNNVLLRVIGD